MKTAASRAGRLGEELSAQGLEVLGPAPLPPRRGLPRHQLLVKGEEDLVERLRTLFPVPPAWLKVKPDPLRLI